MDYYLSVGLFCSSMSPYLCTEYCGLSPGTHKHRLTAAVKSPPAFLRASFPVLKSLLTRQHSWCHYFASFTLDRFHLGGNFLIQPRL